MSDRSQPLGGRTELGNELLRAAARLNRWASRHASFDVPIAQARLLALVDDLGPARVSTLAESDHSSQPSMTTALQRLEGQGLVQRAPDPLDARASLLSLTPSGRATLVRLRRARVAVLAPALDALDDRDLARLRDAIDVMDRLLALASPHRGQVPPSTPPADATSTSSPRHTREES